MTNKPKVTIIEVTSPFATAAEINKSNRNLWSGDGFTLDVAEEPARIKARDSNNVAVNLRAATVYARG